jgi:hypothetical protein
MVMLARMVNTDPSESANAIVRAASLKIETFSADLAERRAKEWQLPSAEQKQRLVSLLQRTNRHDVAEQRIAIVRGTDHADIVYLAEELAQVFKAAGWELLNEPDRALEIIFPGIWVRGPAGQTTVDLIASSLSGIFGGDIVNRQTLAGPLPPAFDRAAVAQIVIGRKPLLQDQIRALERQVATLQNQLGRRLSNKQRETLREVIQGIATNFRPTCAIYYHWLDREAQQYALQLAQVLIPLGVSGVPGGTQEITDNVEGLVIRIKDHNASVPVPPSAMRLSEALTKANIPHRVANRFPSGPPPFPLDDNYFDLSVGRKPDLAVGS